MHIGERTSVGRYVEPSLHHRLVICICTAARGDRTEGGSLAQPLSAVLDSLASQTLLPDLLLVVKDGSASAALGRAVARLPFPSQVQALVPGSQLYEMRNLALQRHPADHVLFIDDDGILLNSRCLEFLACALAINRPALAQLPVLRSAPLAIPVAEGVSNFEWDVLCGRGRHSFDHILAQSSETPIWQDVENACGAALCLTAWRPDSCRFEPLSWGAHYGMETALSQRLKRVYGQRQIMLQNSETAVLNLKWGAPYHDSRPGKVRLQCDTIGDERVGLLSKLAVSDLEDSISRKSPIGFYADYIAGMAHAFSITSQNAAERFLGRTRRIFMERDLIRHPNVSRLESREQREFAFVQAAERLGLPPDVGHTQHVTIESGEEWI